MLGIKQNPPAVCPFVKTCLRLISPSVVPLRPPSTPAEEMWRGNAQVYGESPGAARGALARGPPPPSVSDSASDSFFHMLKRTRFEGGGGGVRGGVCVGGGLFGPSLGEEDHWIGLSCRELQTPHPKGALPLEISLLFI